MAEARRTVEFARGPSAAVILFRYVTGQHLDGRTRSDATFLTDGTEAKPTHWSANPWWPRLAGWKRAAIRVAPAIVAWAWWAHRAATQRATAAVAGVAAGWGLILIVLWQEQRRHYQAVVRPLHEALSRIPPLEAPRKAKDWLAIPLDYATSEDAVGVIKPPRGLAPSDRDKEDITRAVQVKLPRLDTPEVDFSQMHGNEPRIQIRHSAPPPREVTWKQIEAAVAAAGQDEIVFGIGRRDTVVSVSLSSDSPHVGYQGGSGWGKTNAASLVALQFLHRGDNCCFIDGKLISYPWARGLPNVAYGGTIPEIHDLLVWFGEELPRRNEVALAGLQPSGFIHANVGRPWHIFAEELNYVIPQLKDYWADLRAVDKSLPKRSPALAALAALAFAGRQSRLHEHFIAQLITAAATGANDTSVRGNIGIACLARYRLAGWQKMTDLPMEPCPDIPGRIQVVTAARARETQVPYLHLDDEDEKVAAEAAEWARDYATSGTCTPLPAGMPGAATVPGVLSLMGQPSHVASEQPFVVGHDGPVLPAGAGPMGAVTLAEAVAGRLFVSIDAARQARQREGWEKVAGDRYSGYKYKLSDIEAYVNRRGRR